MANGYELHGTLLEACSCGVLCPCWIGEDPDQGTCDAFNAYHFDRGTIGDVDWVKDATAQLTDFISQVGSAYSRAARELLK